MGRPGALRHGGELTLFLLLCLLQFSGAEMVFNQRDPGLKPSCLGISPSHGGKQGKRRIPGKCDKSVDWSLNLSTGHKRQKIIQCAPDIIKLYH